MRVLVTGATGFVGRSLVRALAARGDEVAALTRSPESALRLLPELSQAHRWTPAEEPPPARAFDGVDVVVSLAGESVAGRWTRRKKQAILDSRERASLDLAAGMAEAGPSVFVSASALGYYGDRGEEELTEDAGGGGGFLADVCVRWEAAARTAPPGVRVVLLRTAHVIGPDGGFLRPMRRLANLGLSGPLGGGRQWWPWVHRSDMVGLVLHAIGNDAVEGPMNVCAPAPVRQREFAERLGRVLRRPAFLPAPGLALRLVLGEFASEVLSSRRMTPAAAQRTGYVYQFEDLDAALRDALTGA